MTQNDYPRRPALIDQIYNHHIRKGETMSKRGKYCIRIEDPLRPTPICCYLSERGFHTWNPDRAARFGTVEEAQDELTNFQHDSKYRWSIQEFKTGKPVNEEKP